MTKVSLLIFSLFIVSCSLDKLGQNTGAVTKVDDEVLSKTQAAVCLSDEVLAETDQVSAEKAYNKLGSYKAFGFLKNSGDCAFNSDFRKDGFSYEWFSLTKVGTCLKNGSVWKATSMTRQDNSISVDMAQFNGDAKTIITLYAGYDVELKTLSNQLGIKYYNCAKSTSK